MASVIFKILWRMGGKVSKNRETRNTVLLFKEGREKKEAIQPAGFQFLKKMKQNKKPKPNKTKIYQNSL